MTLANARIPVLGFAAPSGTGKTTLLTRVIGLLSAQGLHVGVIKQAREDFDLDQPGKDSFRLRRAGVERLLLAAENQSALVIELPEPCEPTLAELLELLDQDALDLVLVEGFRDQPFPKIELYRGRGEPRYPFDPWVVAVVTDHPDELEATCRHVLDINDPATITAYILSHVLNGSFGTS